MATIGFSNVGAAGLFCDGVDFDALLENALLDSGHVVRIFDDRKRRYTVGGVPFLHEWTALKFGVADRNLGSSRLGSRVSGAAIVFAATGAEHQSDQA